VSSPSRPDPRPRRRPGLSAQQLLLLSFGALVALGTAGFALVPAFSSDGPLSWVDALFMATSAVCVTGLVVVDPGTAFTTAGQVFLLVLIQAGGLGILTFAGVLVSVLGGRSSLSVEEAAGGPSSALPMGRPVSMLRTAMAVTFTLELAGAALLWASWRDDFGAVGALWPAVFHAVSAFCNAGFSLFADSLAGFRDEPAPVGVVAVLVVVGGLGYPVLQDLRMRARRRNRKLTLHTRLVLVATGLTLAVSTALYWIFETTHAAEPVSAPQALLDALFLAVTTRTAGFHTVGMDALSNPSLALTLGLMWMGGGPASLAGGVKITTAALLGLVLWARLRGHDRVSLAGRTVPDETVHRATGLAVGAVLLLGVFLVTVLAVEPAAGPEALDRERLVGLAFEVTSAFGTVGLSMGATQELSPAGRVLLVPLMLLGRIGPLVVLGAMVTRRKRRPGVRYAHEDVLVGP